MTIRAIRISPVDIAYVRAVYASLDALFKDDAKTNGSVAMKTRLCRSSVCLQNTLVILSNIYRIEGSVNSSTCYHLAKLFTCNLK